MLSLSMGYINHTDHSATTNTDFSFFNKSRRYRANPPVFEGKINALTAGFTLDFRDYIEDGYLRRRTSQGGSYVLFSGDVTYSNNDLIIQGNGNFKLSALIYNIKDFLFGDIGGSCEMIFDGGELLINS